LSKCREKSKDIRYKTVIIKREVVFRLRKTATWVVPRKIIYTSLDYYCSLGILMFFGVTTSNEQLIINGYITAQ